jgi:hypothetical protein
MEFVLFWIGLAVVAGVAANARGRSGIGWFFLSLVISPVIGLLAVLVMRRIEPEGVAFASAPAAAPSRPSYPAKPAPPPPPSPTKKCPDCAEMVQAEAKICRFCRHEFPEPPPKPKLEIRGYGLAKPAAGVLPGVKTCPACYAVNTPESKICKRCNGALPASPEASEDLRRDCRSCGQQIPASARVCRHCGVRQEDGV